MTDDNEKIKQAKEYLKMFGAISPSYLQRKLKITFEEAEKICKTLRNTLDKSV